MHTYPYFPYIAISKKIVQQAEEDKILAALKTDFSVHEEAFFIYGRRPYFWVDDIIPIDTPPKNLPYYRKFENPIGRKFNVNRNQ